MEVTGDLLLGSSSIPAHHVLPGVLTAFAEEHPGVRPSLMVASSAAVTRQVLEGELMAGIVSLSAQADPDLFSVSVIESDIIVIAPANMSPLPHAAPPSAAGSISSLPEISFETASSLHWILRETSSATRRSFEDALRAAGHDARLLRPRLTVDSSHAAVQYVRAGLGVSSATRIAVVDALDRGEIRAYSIAGVRTSRSFSCIMNVRRMPFPAATVFFEFLLAKTRHLRSRKVMDNGPEPFTAKTG
jgi:DNA-binding transcriptional LysR family regulator